MRALHIVKTVDGAVWAALQVSELVRMGVDVHVALPALDGRTIDDWRRSGAALHVADLDFPVTRPWRLAEVCRSARALCDAVAPDIIHTHHVGPTLVLRRALGKNHG